MIIRIKRSRKLKGQFFVELVARNGRIVFVSETYKRLRGAQKAARFALSNSVSSTVITNYDGKAK